MCSGRRLFHSSYHSRIYREMDEDPDDLAVLFFANQAAKEKQKATLPTDDWVKVVEAVLKRKLKCNTTDDISADHGIETNNESNCQKSSDKIIDASSWLVTTMPPTPNKQKVNGIDGIMLDTSDTHCSLGQYLSNSN